MIVSEPSSSHVPPPILLTEENVQLGIMKTKTGGPGRVTRGQSAGPGVAPGARRRPATHGAHLRLSPGVSEARGSRGKAEGWSGLPLAFREKAVKPAQGHLRRRQLTVRDRETSFTCAGHGRQPPRSKMSEEGSSELSL